MSAARLLLLFAIAGCGGTVSSEGDSGADAVADVGGDSATGDPKFDVPPVRCPTNIIEEGACAFEGADCNYPCYSSAPLTDYRFIAHCRSGKWSFENLEFCH